jgi:hypothetical protein
MPDVFGGNMFHSKNSSKYSRSISLFDIDFDSAEDEAILTIAFSGFFSHFFVQDVIDQICLVEILNFRAISILLSFFDFSLSHAAT